MSRQVSSFCFALSLILVAATAGAGPGDHLWSAGYDVTAVAAMDGSGQVATAGTFFGSIDLGGGPVQTANPDGAVFLARHDGSGIHAWERIFEPSGYVTVDRVAADEAGRIFVTGTIYGAGPPGNPGSIDFGGGLLAGENDAYVAGFDSAGNHLFSRVVGAAFPQDLFARGGRVVLTGYAYEAVDFGGGPLGGAGGADAFLACLDASGTHLWSAAFGDAADQGGMAVALDASGAAVLALTTTSAIDFGSGVLTPAGPVGLCLVRFSAAGNHDWSQIFDGAFSSGSGILASLDLDVSPGGLVLLGGQLNGVCDFGGGPVTSNGGGDAFAAVFDGAGTHQWSSHYGGSTTDAVRGVAFDPAGNLVLAGTFNSSSIDFGGGPLVHVSFASDLFLAVLDPSGSHLHSASYAGDFGVWDARVGVSPGGAIFVTGGGSAGLDFGGGPLASGSHFRAVLEGVASVSTAAPRMQLTRLEQNRPNPFNPGTVIRYELGRPGPVLLEVYDLAGRRVATLWRGDAAAGTHEVRWGGRDDDGHTVAAGVYAYRLVTAEGTWARRMTLVK